MNKRVAVVAHEHAPTTQISRLAYGIDDAADALDLSRSRIYELIAHGEIAACKIGKRTVIPTTELVAFLDRHRVVRLADAPAPTRGCGAPPERTPANNAPC